MSYKMVQTVFKANNKKGIDMSIPSSRGHCRIRTYDSPDTVCRDALNQLYTSFLFLLVPFYYCFQPITVFPVFKLYFSCHGFSFGIKCLTIDKYPGFTGWCESLLTPVMLINAIFQISSRSNIIFVKFFAMKYVGIEWHITKKGLFHNPFPPVGADGVEPPTLCL